MAKKSRDQPPDEDALYLRLIARLAAAGVAVGDVAARGAGMAARGAEVAARGAGVVARGAGVAARGAQAAAGSVTETVESALSGAKDAQLFFRVPGGLRHNLKRLAAERDRKMEDLLTEALVDLLIKHGRLLPSPKGPPD